MTYLSGTAAAGGASGGAAVAMTGKEHSMAREEWRGYRWNGAGYDWIGDDMTPSQREDAERKIATAWDAADAVCSQGHPPYDAAAGCGPCMDEMLAGLGDRAEAFPVGALITVATPAGDVVRSVSL